MTNSAADRWNNCALQWYKHEIFQAGRVFTKSFSDFSLKITCSNIIEHNFSSMTYCPSVIEEAVHSSAKFNISRISYKGKIPP